MLATSSIRTGIESLATVLEDQLEEIEGDLLVPLDTYSSHQQGEAQNALAQAYPIWS